MAPKTLKDIGLQIIDDGCSAPMLVPFDKEAASQPATDKERPAGDPFGGDNAAGSERGGLAKRSPDAFDARPGLSSVPLFPTAAPGSTMDDLPSHIRGSDMLGAS